MGFGRPHADSATGRPSSETCIPVEPGGTLMVSLGTFGPSVAMCFLASFALGSAARVCKRMVLNSPNAVAILPSFSWQIPSCKSVLGSGDMRWLSAIMGQALAYWRAAMSFLPWFKSPGASDDAAGFAAGAFAAEAFAG